MESWNEGRRVVITGMGAVTPLGLSLEDNWKGLVAGHSGIGPITLFDASEFPSRIAGEVKNFDFARWTQDDPSLKPVARSTYFALQAAEEAMEHAGLREEAPDSERFGVYFGAGDSGIDFESFASTMGASLESENRLINKSRYVEASQGYMNALRELEAQPFMTVTHLVRRFGIRGPVSNCLTACAASSQAIGEAAEWIRRGDADVILSGGANSMIHPLGVAGFSLLTALSTRNDDPAGASRPFDKERDGFVISEGAGVVILEELEHARRRGARIYGEIAGYGSTADAYRLTDMDPQGEGAYRAFMNSLIKAGVGPEAIDYVNAHGTATRVNDMIETIVIKRALGTRAAKVPVSSIKSMVGHMIAAAGVLEVIVCLLAIRDGVIPPTINYEHPDPQCDLDYVPNESRMADVRFAVSNSFGFGGQNICLAMRRYEG